MFPDLDSCPTELSKMATRVFVAGAIAFQFVMPPNGVRLWRCSVLRTAVPKASMHIHSHPRFRESDIDRATTKARNRPADAITQPARVQQSAQGHFWQRPGPRLPAHPGSDSR